VDRAPDVMREQITGWLKNPLQVSGLEHRYEAGS
jgi:hypothetical protein